VRTTKLRLSTRDPSAPLPRCGPPASCDGERLLIVERGGPSYSFPDGLNILAYSNFKEQYTCVQQFQGATSKHHLKQVSQRCLLILFDGPMHHTS
jgi:hypothetical protein